MNKNISIFPNRAHISTNSSARFFYLIDAIARNNEPTATQLDSLESSYRSTGDFLSECPEFSDLLQHIHPQGSRQLGTIIRPINNSRDGFDIDFVARLDRRAMQKYGGENGPSLLLKNLGDALSRYADKHQLGIKRWERCITLEYAGGMCADIAPIIDDPMLATRFGDTHGRIPDRKLKLYDSTNPRGYAKFFDEIAAISPRYIAMEALTKTFDIVRAEIMPLSEPQEVFNRLLSRLVQIMKLHRNLAFSSEGIDQNLIPSSTFITSLAALCYAKNAINEHFSPLDLMLDIVEDMPTAFQRNVYPDGTEEWVLENPSAPNDNLASGMNTPTKQAAFIWWHERLVSDLRGLLETIEGQYGMNVLLERIRDAFGERAVTAIQRIESDKFSGLKNVGKISIITTASAPISVQARPHTFFGSK